MSRVTVTDNGSNLTIDDETFEIITYIHQRRGARIEINAYRVDLDAFADEENDDSGTLTLDMSRAQFKHFLLACLDKLID
jgi:hypothetical protein